MTMPFGTRVDAALDKRGSLCVGIDPHRGLLEAWGLSYDVDGLRRFAAACAEAFADTAAVVKPQSAFFEVFGSAGIAVLEDTVRELRAGGALVLLDVKRGDIGSTMAAYAAAYLDRSAPLAVDAITASPYLGVGSLTPAFDTALEHGAGVFVLDATSNPEGPQVQAARTEAGATIAQTVADDVSALNAGAEGLGSIGLVVGATITDRSLHFDHVNGPILAPGVGTQGGTPDTVRAIFGSALRAVVPSVSREVLRRGPDVAALRAAVAEQTEAFAFLRA